MCHDGRHLLSGGASRLEVTAGRELPSSIIEARRIISVVFDDLLSEADARRASEVLDSIRAHGLRFALTGGLAINAQLHSFGYATGRRPLGDVDLVVENFASIPRSLATAFLQHHVHAGATEGRTLLQLVDRVHAVRIDLFVELGATLSRARPTDYVDGLRVVSLEDLAARTTALVCGRLRRGRSIDPKHVRTFTALRGLGRPEHLAAAWEDHRQGLTGTLQDAASETARLLDRHPELVTAETYSADAPRCDRCRQHGPFRPAPRHTIVEILGYC